ncbi:uncharacterized protein BX663DRAFT_513815 [Cokeromyces recurvatus]|uniref:uncharacterized protein n=1 Tax=Cokeromyces recurvatus TaxID=90255 RepID=UPI00221FF8C4|nr:uncharacterized protein BX663DRAFT_513815 [Cokeromyces recurvatus]KAI7901720.1 hypothetical protein BX663DRAFT_513815 [Cokeromyces recurvatus]
MLQIIMNKFNSFKWSWLQYPFFTAIIIFDIVYIQFPPLWCRLLLAILLLSSPFIPYIRRFTVPAMVVFTWLITFYAVQFIPNSIKPKHIFVDILPTLERIIYGANLSEIISQHTHPILDIFAWLPYGIIHFAFPFIFALALFIFGPPGTLPVFGKAFGYMNLAGVLTQLIFPTSPPWYELSYGSAPADYSIHGQPGGLARIDKILGLNLYGTTFGNSPLVFGAFPSLHSGCATIEMFFLSWLYPKARPYCVFHVLWMWFATMYLTHHYLIDLVGGSIYATLAFFCFRQYLPIIRPDCRTRLDYIDSPIPIKNTFMNFVRSIEMETFMKTLLLREADDTEAMMRLSSKEIYHSHSSIQSNSDREEEEDDNDDDDITYINSDNDEDTTAHLFQHIPLKSVHPIYINTTDSRTSSRLPSVTNSPTSSEPSSPATPCSDYYYSHNELKH